MRARRWVLWAVTLVPLALPWRSRWDDVTLYAAWARAFAAGAWPYRDVPFEYPPGALLPLGMPLLLGGAWPWAGIAFVLATGLMGALVRLVFVHPSPRAWRFACALTLLELPLYAVLFKRLDLWAVAATTVALVGLVRRPQSLVAGFWLALGTSIKLYPLVLVAPMALHARARGVPSRVLARQGAVFGLTLALPMAAAWALVGPTAWSWAHYHRARGLQVTSSWVGAYLSITGLGQPLDIARRFGADEVVAPWADAAAQASTAVTLVLLAVTLAARATSCQTAQGLYRTALALVTAVLLGAKVFSPQYVTWLLPLGILGSAGRLRRSWPVLLPLLLVALLTGLLYPGEAALAAGQTKRQVALIARTVVLVLLWGYLTVTGRRRRAP